MRACTAEEGDLQVRSATVNDATAIVKLHVAENPFGSWFRNPITRDSPCSYEDLTPFQRLLHGGDWMDDSLCRRHIHEYITRGFPIMVAEEGRKVVGECELWLADEGPPFKKYAALEMLMASKDAGKESVERLLLEKSEERCRKMSIKNLDVGSKHGGDSLDFRRLGFKELWDTRECEIDLREMEEPDVDFKVTPVAEDYRITGFLQAWNHREPPQLRFEIALAAWPPFKIAGVDRHNKHLLVRVKVDQLQLGFLLLASRCDFFAETVTEIDVWSGSAEARRTDSVQTIVKCAAATAERLGAGLLRVFVPKHFLPAMRELGFRGGEKQAPWLRKELRD
jgi:hypothetical protein